MVNFLQTVWDLALYSSNLVAERCATPAVFFRPFLCQLCQYLMCDYHRHVQRKWEHSLLAVHLKFDLTVRGQFSAEGKYVLPSHVDVSSFLREGTVLYRCNEVGILTAALILIEPYHFPEGSTFLSGCVGSNGDLCRSFLHSGLELVLDWERPE